MTTIAYLTGEYPRATDTFIQREVRAVEAAGVKVERFAVREPGSEHLVGTMQREERGATTYLLGHGSAALVRSTLSALWRAPHRFVRAASLAARTRRAGLDGVMRQLAYFAEAAVLAEEMRRRKVEHLHNHFGDSSCTVAMLASELSGIGYSFTLHGPAIFFEPHEWHLGTKIERARFVATISNFARSQAALFCSPDAWGHLYIVHCGVSEPEAIDADDSGWPRSDGTTDLLFVGRLDPVKGVMVLFETIAQLVEAGENVRLVLVGDGPQRVELEELTADLGLSDRVRFTGYQNQQQVQAHLERCDVFVLPSFAEGVPVSLMEAMARRRPVIATNVGGVTELVEDGISGRVVPPGDDVALRSAIEDLARDPQLREKMGAAGAAKVHAEFNSSTEAQRLVSLFDRAILSG